jgi:hypothetical protein
MTAFPSSARKHLRNILAVFLSVLVLTGLISLGIAYFTSLDLALKIVNILVGVTSTFVVALLTYYLYKIEMARVNPPHFKKGGNPWQVKNLVSFPIVNVGFGRAENVEIDHVKFDTEEESITIDDKETLNQYQNLEVMNFQAPADFKLPSKLIPEGTEKVWIYLKSDQSQRYVSFDMSNLQQLDDEENI